MLGGHRGIQPATCQSVLPLALGADFEQLGGDQPGVLLPPVQRAVAHQLVQPPGALAQRVVLGIVLGACGVDRLVFPGGVGSRGGVYHPFFAQDATFHLDQRLQRGGHRQGMAAGGQALQQAGSGLAHVFAAVFFEQVIQQGFIVGRQVHRQQRHQGGALGSVEFFQLGHQLVASGRCVGVPHVGKQFQSLLGCAQIPLFLVAGLRAHTGGVVPCTVLLG